MGKKRKTVREVLGAILGVGVFALAVLLLNRGLGWPGSWPTLVATGALGFLASALVSRALRGPWAARAGAACALILLVACPLAGWPFRIPSQEQGGYETRYAYFITYLLGTEDNGPVENVAIVYLCPNTNNKYPEIDGNPITYSSWMLYYLEDNGDLRPQAQFWWSNSLGKWEFEIYQFYGERGAPPTVVNHGVDPRSNPFGPVIGATFDRLYPREVLWHVSGVDVPKGKGRSLTLRAMRFEDNVSFAWLGCYSAGKIDPYDKKVYVRFVAQLWEPAGENTLKRIEFYQREIEYCGEGAVRLIPSL